MLIAQVKQGEHAMRMLALSKQREQELEMELQRARAAAEDADLKWQTERVGHLFFKCIALSLVEQLWYSRITKIRHVACIIALEDALPFDMILHSNIAEGAMACFSVQHRQGQTRTVAELQQHVEALQKEKKLLQAHVAQHKAAAARADAAREEARSALATLKVALHLVLLRLHLKRFHWSNLTKCELPVY